VSNRTLINSTKSLVEESSQSNKSEALAPLPQYQGENLVQFDVKELFNNNSIQYKLEKVNFKRRLHESSEEVLPMRHKATTELQVSLDNIADFN
jgi:hypothetical protein